MKCIDSIPMGNVERTNACWHEIIDARVNDEQHVIEVMLEVNNTYNNRNSIFLLKMQPEGDENFVFIRAILEAHRWAAEYLGYDATDFSNINAALEV